MKQEYDFSRAVRGKFFREGSGLQLPIESLLSQNERMTMPAPNICTEQSCTEKVRRDHYLCREHWEEFQEGIIDECPQCGVYKDAEYRLCIECNKEANAARRKKSKQAEDKQKTRRYDPVRADTFDERSALLEDDQKAQDKRQLFHAQQGKCVYCGNEYQYDKLEIEHMIPKARGGPDNIRNCQLACRSCNLAKGTKTDIEFRQEHASHLPQKERTPADPPIDPKLLKVPAQKRRFWGFRRR